ncbi:membrane protein insertase YidC [Alteraurantiacibacter aestuarii]|uniref:Membrane protein insertase YidC n=1 Tax=Alteraurantiacibacter aestuarii TaxID=650004 RepID=A0A844ZNI4_9SPHN|nr:membrane protein insertase YidC [Alteraurantiacibacter aestuarii]MXO89104.1 membrane protein insertase YidC [Alteraurantiacibacter aestuarii]
MDNQRNLILAVVLSAALLFGWDFVMTRFFPQPVVAEQSQTASSGASSGVDTGIDASGAPVAQAAGPGVEAVLARDLDAELAAPGRLPINAPEIVGSINPVGARIDDIELKTHRQTVDKDSGPIRWFAPAGTDVQQFAQFGWVGDGIALPDARTQWSGTGELTQETPLTLSWDNGQGQTFILTFSIDEHYMLTVEQSVRNDSDGSIALRPYAFVNRTSLTASHSTWNVHSGPIAAIDNEVDFDWNYDEVAEEGPVNMPGRTEWVGFTDIYWMSALIADDDFAATSAFRSTGNDTYRADLLYETVSVPAGATMTRSTRLFAGAKESAVLDAYEDQGVEKFGLAIDWGWFRFIAWPMWQVLIFLFGLVGNFGVAIICLTIIIRGLMFPIAQKQFASMAQMRAVQPKMKALQERYKDDKPQLQQEMAKLYKEEKVNPLAGCLPIFIQIPIFFALYKSLLLAIEMRHEPFVLWIKDLSAPDPATILNLFGLLDFTPPGFLSIGVLAVLLGLTMWLQFKLNPAAMDPMQQQIFMIMPWVLMFVMAPFAAGLLLYWITSNLLTLGQQKYLYSRHPQLRAQAEKDAAEKARNAERKG